MKKLRTRKHIIEALGLNCIEKQILLSINQRFKNYKKLLNFNIMSTSPRTFPKSSVTYGEMIEVLEQLGYHPEFDGQHNRYINAEHNSILILSIKPSNEMLEKVYFETYSYRLYMQDVIKEEDGLLQMIQKNRLKMRKKDAKLEQLAA